MTVVLATLGEPTDPALDAALGADRAAELRAAVAAHAARIGLAVGTRTLASTGVPGAGFEGTEPFDEPAPGAPSDDLTRALSAALAGHDGPVLLLATDVPRLDEGLARTALDDLGRGCAISLASGFEARACLLALARPDPRLFALVATGASRRAIVDLVETAAEAGGEVGFLRHERRLVTPADAAALAADPLADPALRALASPPR